jgi:hypothetical protein
MQLAPSDTIPEAAAMSTTAASSALLLDLFGCILSAAEGALERWAESRGLVTPGAVERALGLLAKVGGAVCDAAPWLRMRREDREAVDELLDRLGRVLALLEGLATQFRQSPHGILSTPQLQALANRLRRCRGC